MMAGEEEEIRRRKRGHPRVYDAELTNATLMKYKESILEKEESGEYSIVKKDDTIWNEIAFELENKTEKGKPARSAVALYTYSCCNEPFRRMLDPTFSGKPAVVDDEDIETEEVSDPSFLDDTLNRSIDHDFEFRISEPATDYLALIEERSSSETNKKNGITTRRTRLKCIPDVYQDFIHNKCWQNARSRHGFRFRGHTINQTFSGQFFGDCACGSKLDCLIEVEDNVMVMSCKATKGLATEPCSLRPVRGPKRRQWGEKLLYTRPKAFQATLAGEMMDEGDPWPALIPTKAVLRTIRHEAVARQYQHPDPLRALEILHQEKMKDEITLINSNPVMICYSSTGQQQLYTTLAQKGGLSIAIDSSGSLNQPLIRPDSSRSGDIFLYHAVVRTNDIQISLAQMLSEQHNTRAILLWLNNFTKSLGLPAPAEVVTDGATALQCACIRAFTQYSTTTDYVNSFLTTEVPPLCWIRGDAAHFLKTYVTLLHDVRTEVARYYKTGIGQLIICRDINRAKVIIRSLLTTSQSEYIGSNADGSDSAAHEERNVLIDLFTNASDTLDCDALDEPDDTANDDKPQYDPCSDESSAPNLWAEFGKKINDSVKSNIVSKPGTELSAYFVKKFAKKFLTDIEKLPMWSCVFRDRFSTGRIPATSSQAENEFYQTKHILFHNCGKIRVDRFVEVQTDYYRNLLKLHDADMKNKERIESNSETSAPRGANMSENESRQTASTESGQNPKEECPYCVNGHLPTGAHKCNCGKAVHSHDKCSQRIGDEEGYGEKRRCFECAAKEKNMSTNGNTQSANCRSSQRLKKKQPANASTCPSTPDQNINISTEYPTNLNESFSEEETGTVTDQNGFHHDDSDSPHRRGNSPLSSNTFSKTFDRTNVETESYKRKNPPKVDESTSETPGNMSERSPNSVTGGNARQKRPRIVKSPLTERDDDRLSSTNEPSTEAETRETTAEDMCTEISSESNVPMKSDGIGSKTGESLPVKKYQGFYFGESYPVHIFDLVVSLRKLPIMKSGDDPTLQAIRKGGFKYNLQSTDSFDALYHIMLATSLDSPLFCEHVVDKHKAESRFMQLINKMVSKDNPAVSYGSRFDILSEHFLHKQTGHREIKCIILNCESSITDMCEKLFKEMPTVIKSSTCDKGCKVNGEHVFLQVRWEDLIRSNSPEALASVMGHNNRSKCRADNCSGYATSSIIMPMAFFLLAIVVDESKSQMSLSEVPVTIKLPTMTMEYKLRGVVAYQPPLVTTARRAKCIRSKGFNTAYCFRNKRWFHCRKKSPQCDEAPKVCVRLIVYSI